MMNWLAPEIEVTVGDRTRLASVQRMEVVAARSQPIASAYLELSNVRFEWEGGAADGDPLLLRWGYRGQDLAPLFDGTAMCAHARDTFSVWGLCRARALADTRLTRTYQGEAADAVVSHLVGDLGFASIDVSSCAETIDKLPLRDNTVAQAIRFLNRRLELDRAFYADAEGGFHWGERDTTQAPAHTFTHGEDVLDFQAIPGGRHLLTVMGAPLWHSQVVTLVDAAGAEAPRYFIEQVRHTVGFGGSGTRSHLWLSEVPDG
ncbi:MAG: hypothetical protein ABIK09_10175 [Pseudomonadota bacterium]